jgi:hypothetical protein
MTSNKFIKIAVGLGIIFFALYMLYMALPYLIAFAANIIYLSGFIIFVIIGIYAFTRLIKWMFK